MLLRVSGPKVGRATTGSPLRQREGVGLNSLDEEGGGVAAAAGAFFGEGLVFGGACHGLGALHAFEFNDDGAVRGPSMWGVAPPRTRYLPS